MKKIILLIVVASVLLLGCATHKTAVVQDASPLSGLSQAYYEYSSESEERPLPALYLYEEGRPDIELQYYYPLHLKTGKKVERTESKKD